ncbi:MAG: 4-(cytidine 5'-diphospho)-2-C-methyl-D-erythritol kinase [Planctomycetia bacterium]|nr:4-(cytidine 5'-diphospho)-2-C-methyl-D-erythritol kinase [Planctomycetia bacterium]
MLCRGQTTGVTVFAPAKLNLFLKVLGKRADGYHELETLMVSVGLYDTLVFSDAPAGHLSLVCRDGRVPAARAGPREMPGDGEDNLVLRAARLLRETTGTAHGARIELVKRIPLSAGLAGGSSDAAATLWGLNRLWNLGLDASELMRLASRLGSDIPFFLCSASAAICRGRGEIVEPLPLAARYWFVVARPATGLATAEVYRGCRPSTIGWTAAALASALAGGRLPEAAGLFHNALQEPAERLNADVTRLKRAFARQPFAGHQMSGSGTSYFGLCRSRRQAAQYAARLRATRLGDVFVVSNRP